MNRRQGFTLVELMVSSMLSGILLIIALPLLVLGQNAGYRFRRLAELSVAGDGIFEYVSEELKSAKRLYIGDCTENRPMEGEWNVLLVSMGKEGISDILMRWSGEAEVFEPAGEPLYEEAYYWQSNLNLELYRAGEEEGLLSVKLSEGTAIIYERTEILWLPGLIWETAECAEDSRYENSKIALWYQK